MEAPPAATTIAAESSITEPITIEEQQLAEVPGGPKLRLMCSYGGHIIPTPHEKSLRYIGGETRMVAMDRRSSLASIVSRLSSSLLGGRRSFLLKYQLPNEDLDSLVSLTSDEDVENLVEEYDRIVASGSNSRPALRIRLFVFFAKPETAASMGSLLDDAKSETWFVDALNSAALLPRGFSDSAVIDQLLDLDNVGKQSGAQEVFAGMSDSLFVENSSSPSFGSSSSSPSMANLPSMPSIRVRREERGTVGIEEQFAAQTVVSAKTESSAPAAYSDQVEAVTEDERLDLRRLRKPPLPSTSLTSQQVRQNKNSLPYNLPSPDSVASDTSIASESGRSKTMISQDPVQNTSREITSADLQKAAVYESNHPDHMMQRHETTCQVPWQADHLYSQQHQQMQQQQQQFHQLQHYFIASVTPVSETGSHQIPSEEHSDHHPNTELQESSSQNQRMQHLQETVYLSSPQSTEHQQQQFTYHPSMQQSYEISTLQAPEQLGQHMQHHQQKRFVTSTTQPHLYHPMINQADQQQWQDQISQQQHLQGNIQYSMHHAPQVPMPSSYYSMHTHPQLHHQTLYMVPIPQTHTSSQSSNISDMPPATLPAPSETALLMSTNPTLAQVPPPQQQQQQYLSYSQFHHPHQSMATHVYGYSANQHHLSSVHQYQTMNSTAHSQAVGPSESVSPPPPPYQH